MNVLEARDILGGAAVNYDLALEKLERLRLDIDDLSPNDLKFKLKEVIFEFQDAQISFMRAWDEVGEAIRNEKKETEGHEQSRS